VAGPALAQPAETAPAEFPPVVILSDDPTPIDELGDAHRRVATAIAFLVRQGADSGRSIALTGSWGSGKSSVIEMLRGQLQATPDYEPSLFQFGAWAHQGDPLRRAFLERLIEHAVLLDSRERPPKETPDKIWSDELDLVTGRREKSEAHADRPLTTWGLAVAISLLFCLPMGGAFLSKVDAHSFFWTSTFASNPCSSARPPRTQPPPS
jgi:D-serine deaminase-like pyridoxal phosphate-dependent protein